MSKDYRFKTDPVQWHEGMPLAPQHFQLNDSRYQSILSFLLESAGSHNWGLTLIDIDQLLLAKGVFRVQSVQGVLPDGSVVNYEEHAQAPKLDLPLDEVVFQDGKPQKIYLALPAYSPDQPSASGNSPRYISTVGDLVVDENGSASEPSRIPRLAPNLYLIVGQTPSSKFVSLPIAELAKEGGQYSLTKYTAPCLYFSPKDGLRASLEELSIQIRSKIMYSIERYDASSDNPAQKHTKQTIDVLIEALLPFEILMSAGRVHPLEIYRGLVTLASKVASLKTSVARIPAFNVYDHNNIDVVFAGVVGYVRDVLTSLSDNLQIRKFQKKRGYFGLALPTVWHSQKLTVGVKHASGGGRSAAYNWIENALIGTEGFAQSIIDRRIIGAVRRVIPQEEKTLISAPKDISLVEIQIEPEFINLGDVLYIFNPSDTADERPADIYHYVRLEDL